jgi:hypothetical protein
MKIYYNGEKSTLGCQCCKPKLGIHHQLPVPMSASTQMVDGPRSIHVPLPPSLQQSRSPQSWKRKGKCQSCRQARKKVRFQKQTWHTETNHILQCQPEIRIWPKKCLRCVERGLSCSIPFLANGTVAAERGYASEQAEIAWNFLTIDQRGLGRCPKHHIPRSR